MPRRKSSPLFTEAIMQLKASALATLIETCSLRLVLMPKRTRGREDVLRALDDMRELVRALHPDAVDPASTRVLPKPDIHRNEILLG